MVTVREPPAKPIEFRTDPEFCCLCPMLSAEEFDGLRESIRAHGCREPLVVWQEEGLLLDGHNRLAACKEFGVEFATVAYSFPDRDAARNWIIDNALARRNLTREQRDYLAGKRLLSEKKDPAATRIGEGRRLPQSEGASGETAERIAKQVGVSRATVERAAAYAENVDKIAATAGSKAKRAILSGEVKLTREQVARAAEKGVRNVTELRAVAKKRAAPKAAPRSGVGPLASTPQARLPRCGLTWARLAIEQLRAIRPNDVQCDEAFDLIEGWIRKRRSEIKLLRLQAAEACRLESKAREVALAPAAAE